VQAVRWSDIDFRPNARKLRQFAGLWTVFFAGLALWQGYRHHTVAAGVCAGLGLGLGPLGLLFPQIMRPIFIGWTVAAFPIGWIVSNVLLAVLFYGLFTPIGLLFRLFGRDALQLRRPERATTYWSPKPMPTDLRRYLRQF
jgi:hypothetical protein